MIMRFVQRGSILFTFTCARYFESNPCVHLMLFRIHTYVSPFLRQPCGLVIRNALFVGPLRKPRGVHLTKQYFRKTSLKHFSATSCSMFPRAHKNLVYKKVGLSSS